MNTQGPTVCPRCGGELDRGRYIERSVREGNDVALVTVQADICLRCGETFLYPGMVDRLSRTRDLLRAGAAAPAVGRVFDLRQKVA
jgi:YgiT-type zinc finger domain-containing protein